MEFRDFFRDELAFLKLLSREFSYEHPQFNEFISHSAYDKDVEFLLESFAFLMTKLRMKNEDAFPEVTQNLLAEVWPMPLRPIPSTTILKFTPQPSGEIQKIQRHGQVKGLTGDGVECRFRTCREITVQPLELDRCYAANETDGSVISMKFRWFGTMDEDGGWVPQPFRIFIGSDTTLVGDLQLWFEQYLVKTTVTTGEKTLMLSSDVAKMFFPNKEDLILPLDVEQFWRLQLYEENLSLPAVNDFINIDISEEIQHLELDEEGCFTLNFHFNVPFAHENRITDTSFILNCVPAVNLFKEQLPSIDFVKNVTNYTLPSDSDKYIFKITNVHSPLEASGDARGGKIKYLPITQFSSKRYQISERDLFYQVMLEKDVDEKVENKISFINIAGEKVSKFLPKVFICEVLSSNGKAAGELNIGDISLPTQDISSDLDVQNITKPTLPKPAIVDSYIHWTLISHLALSPIFLRDKKSLQQILKDLYYHAYTNHPEAHINNKKLDGIQDIVSTRIDWIEKGVVVRGIKMQIYLNPKAFLDVGDMYRFGCVLAQVFPFCITTNNLLMVDLIDSETKEIWPLKFISGTRDQL